MFKEIIPVTFILSILIVIYICFQEKVKKNKRKKFHKLKMHMLRIVMQKQIKKMYMHK